MASIGPRILSFLNGSASQQPASIVVRLLAGTTDTHPAPHASKTERRAWLTRARTAALGPLQHELETRRDLDVVAPPGAGFLCISGPAVVLAELLDQDGMIGRREDLSVELNEIAGRALG